MKDPDDFARPIEGNFLFERPVGVALIGVLALAFALVEPVDKGGDAVLDAGITAAVDGFKRFDLPAALDEFPGDEAMAGLGLAHRADAPRGAELLGEIGVVFDFYAKVRVPVAKPEEQQGHGQNRGDDGCRACRPAFRLSERAAQRPHRARLHGFPVQKALEFAGQIVGRLVAAAGIFFQALLDDRLEVAGNLRMEAADAGRLVVLDLLHQHGFGHVVGRAEKGVQREQLPQRHPQAVDVGAPVEFLDGQDLLRTGVPQSSHDLPRSRQFSVHVVGQLRHAQVNQDGVRAVGRHHDVARLDVAMDDARLMQGVRPRATCAMSSAIRRE